MKKASAQELIVIGSAPTGQQRFQPMSLMNIILKSRKFLMDSGVLILDGIKGGKEVIVI